MQNRQRDEIVRDVLQTAMGQPQGVNLTTIMGRAYLSYEQARAYVIELTEKGLLDNESTSMGRTTYQTTPKGAACLGALNSITELIAVESMRRAKVDF